MRWCHIRVNHTGAFLLQPQEQFVSPLRLCQTITELHCISNINLKLIICKTGTDDLLFF